MTIDELIEWLESAKRQEPGRKIGDYEVLIDGLSADPDDFMVDHVSEEVELM